LGSCSCCLQKYHTKIAKVTSISVEASTSKTAFSLISPEYTIHNGCLAKNERLKEKKERLKEQKKGEVCNGCLERRE
jgi:hypothetical protein